MAYSAYGAYPAYAPYPVYVPVPMQTGAKSAPPQIVYVDRAAAMPPEINVFGGPPPMWDGAGTVAATGAQPAPPRQSTPSFADLKLPKLPARLSISSWATMRNQSGSDSLGTGGMLGGSQAGARLLWKFDPHLSASFRTSAPINSQRGAEAALGMRYQPLANLPVAVTLERRHAFRDYGQSAFALFAEGGVYGRPMPWNSTLDAYFQTGVVDFNNPDWFADGQAALKKGDFAAYGESQKRLQAAIVKAVAAQPTGSVTLVLPVPSSWLDEALHEYLSTYHWQPLVNGYSGWQPAEYVQTLERLRTFPDAASIDRLKQLNVSYVVITDHFDPAAYRRLLESVKSHAAFDPPMAFPDPVFNAVVLPLRR